MAEGANAPVKAPPEALAAAPIEARKTAIRAARNRMSSNLDVLECRVRTAVGIRDHYPSAPPGQRRAVTAVSVLLTVRRLWRLPFWRLAAIGAVTAGLVTMGTWRGRRSELRSAPETLS